MALFGPAMSDLCDATSQLEPPWCTKTEWVCAFRPVSGTRTVRSIRYFCAVQYNPTSTHVLYSDKKQARYLGECE